MQTKHLLASLTLLSLGLPVHAQDAPAPATQPAPAVQSTPVAPPAAVGCGAACCGPSCSICPNCDGPGTDDSRGWVSAEYLLWWTKDGPTPFGSGLDFGTASGIRVTAGRWLGDTGALGVEASGFLLERRAASESGTGVIPPSIIALPVPEVGTSTVAGTSRLWGAELNALTDLARDCDGYASLLVGLRFLDLQEGFAATLDTAGAPLVSIHSNSTFGTQNSFWGGQFGFRTGWRFGWLSADLLGKLALGWTHEAVRLDSTTRVTAFGIPQTIGVVARSTSDHFAVAPELGAQVGAELRDGLRAFVGYNFLYLTSVVRPGDQFAGSAEPFRFKTTEYWAQGLSFGVEWRY